MQLPSATPDFATASMIVCPISGVINRIAALPSACDGSFVRSPVRFIIVRSGAMPMNPSATSWSAPECGRNSRRDKDGAHESSPACVGQLTR